MKLSRRAFIGLAGGFVAALAYPTVGEPYTITVSELNLEWFDDLKAVHISDTHFGSYWFNEQAALNTISQFSPDLIFHTGDLITYMSGLENALKFLERLSSIAPIFMVAGNHDHWSGLGSEGLKEEAISVGEVHVLNNEYVDLGPFIIAGVDDPYTYHDDPVKAIPKTDRRVVLLAHSPQIVGKVVTDLVLTGHTHGGQVRLPFIGPPYLPLPRAYRKYDQGLFIFEEGTMYVTRGLGMSFLPLRFMCPPEIVLIRGR